MKTYEELQKTSAYWLTLYETSIFNAVNDWLIDNAATTRQFADKADLMQWKIDSIIQGHSSLKLENCVKIALALDMDLLSLLTYKQK